METTLDTSQGEDARSLQTPTAAELANMLDPAPLRIARIDMEHMELQLQDGTRLPLARLSAESGLDGDVHLEAELQSPPQLTQAHAQVEPGVVEGRLLGMDAGVASPAYPVSTNLVLTNLGNMMIQDTAAALWEAWEERNARRSAMRDLVMQNMMALPHMLAGVQATDTAREVKMEDSSNDKLPVMGFEKTSLIDYPGHTASVIFFGGCNLRCPYCHNKELACMELRRKPLELILIYLEQERVKHVVLTGGEPTLYINNAEFKRLVSKLDARGVAIKLDTNGTVVSISTLGKPFRYFALDYKMPVHLYGERLGLNNSSVTTFQRNIAWVVEANNAAALRHGSVAGELRTTVHRKLLSPADLIVMRAYLDGVGYTSSSIGLYGSWFLQQYRKCEGFDPELQDTATYTDEELAELAMEVGAVARGVSDELYQKTVTRAYEMYLKACDCIQGTAAVDEDTFRTLKSL